MICGDCGTEVSTARLSCPVCRSLVHRKELEQLAQQARTAQAAGDINEEIRAWRGALELLPSESRQHAFIAATVGQLSRRLESSPGSAAETDAPAEAGPRRHWRWAGLGALGLLGWKLKSVLALLLTKGKFLLAGLTKSTTFFSMVLSLGVYWTAFGWFFALGIVVCLYVHEMGHVAALHRFGIPASAPMFVPGLGAFVRLRQYPVDPREDARVGLAGPLWGLGAAVGAYLVFLATSAPGWGAIARVAAWINLFNLLPVWQLDGGRGFRALSRGQGFLVASVVALMWFLTGEGLLVLLILAAVFSAWRGKTEERGDRIALLQFLVLISALSTMCLIRVPME